MVCLFSYARHNSAGSDQPDLVGSKCPYLLFNFGTSVYHLLETGEDFFVNCGNLSIWEMTLRQKAFLEEMHQRIAKAVKALYDFAKNRDLIFSKEAEVSIGNGIIAEAILKGLDPTDEGQRKKAAKSLLARVNWKGTYQSSGDLAATRTEQFCEEMNVPKEILATLLLAAGGKGGVSVGGGGGGSNNELTNWDGTKKNSGWSRSR